MALRNPIPLALLTAALLPAQEPTPAKPAPATPTPAIQTPGAPAAGQNPGVQNPAVQAPGPRSPADQIGDLRRELERLQSEIAYVRDQVAGSTDELRDKLHNRALDLKAIDAGRSAAASPLSTFNADPVQRKPARLMTPDEQQSLPSHIAMTVNGSLIGDADFQQMVDYLATLPAAGDETQRKQRAAMELVRIHAVLGAFPEAMEQSLERIRAAATEIREGKDFSEVQKRYGMGPNMIQDGKVQITRFCPYGLAVEQAAFAGEKGAMAGPVRGLTGFVLLMIDEHTAGDSPQTEAVEARMLMIPYTDEPAELDRVRLQAATGQATVIVRKPEMLALLPAIYQAAPAPADKSDKLKPAVEPGLIKPATVPDAPEEPAKPAKQPEKDG